MFTKPASRQDRRRHERRPFSDYIQFKNDATGELVGDLADISHGGFRLEGTRKTSPNSELRFRVDMPPEVRGRASIVFTARSRWIRPHDIDPRMYVSGYQLQNIDPTDVRSFEQLFAQCDPRRSGRGAAPDYIWQN